jgi:hypothetical protein
VKQFDQRYTAICFVYTLSSHSIQNQEVYNSVLIVNTTVFNAISGGGDQCRAGSVISKRRVMVMHSKTYFVDGVYVCTVKIPILTNDEEKDLAASHPLTL